MTDYNALAVALKTTLQADAILGDSANIKTIETRRRGFSLSDEKDAQFFSPGDLPAIAIIANARAKDSALVTTNEIRETLRAEIILISRSRDNQAGLDAHQTLVFHLERVLDKQKSSANDLGIDAFVRALSTTDEQIKSGEYYYLISTTAADIELTAAF